jgi:PKD repeat protein
VYTSSEEVIIMKRYLPIGTVLVLLFLLGGVPAVSAETITITPSSGSVVIGETITVTLTMDEVPNGLSGYVMNVTLESPSKAEIVGVTYPSWATLNSVTGVPSDNVEMNTCDLSGQVQAGATDVLLATVDIRGDAIGETNVTLYIDPDVNVHHIDDDDGNLIVPTVNPSVITVLGPPIANFTAGTTIGNSPLSVQFTDCSEGIPTTWAWDFGDDTTSTLQSPLHVYTTPGDYTVSLTASNIYGSDAIVQTDLITVKTPPAADFEANTTLGVPPLTVEFTDLSTGDDLVAWYWEFGDGANETAQSPVHAYTTTGDYTVTLTIENPWGNATEEKVAYISVQNPPDANFTASSQIGNAPFTVVFTDTSTGVGIDTWQWIFGDGATSTQQHPTHTYTAPGLYTVSLTAESPYGNSTVVRTDSVEVKQPPFANFTANQTEGVPPLSVQFTDLSTGDDLASWYWDFGDGTNSTDRHPFHSFGAGTFTVTLTVANAWGEDTTVEEAFITTVQPLPGLAAIPTDTDGDGFFEDINGNGRKDFNDVVLFYQSMSWIGANEPIVLFDYNENGRIDFDDVVELYHMIS